MPLERADQEGEPPKDAKGNRVPHIGVAIDSSGRLYGLGPGSPFLIIEDPANKDAIFPLTQVEVNHRYMDFKCRCQNPDCTRKVRFKAKWSGIHPPKDV